MTGQATRSPAREEKWLTGVRVVELGQFLAAPFGGMIFSDLGAEVIKIERPVLGDDGRRMGPPFRGPDSLSFQELNRGKCSVEIDLKDETGRRHLMELVATADIVINNLRPGVSEALGVDAATLTAAFPSLVYCTLSALGNRGPYRLRPGFEPLVQAYSGLASVNGYSDRPAVRTGPSVVDLGSGMWVAISAMAALRVRDKTGKGAIVNLSLLETAMTWITQDVSGYINEGRVPTRRANGHPLLAPYDTFEASDAPIMLSCGNDRQFAKFARVADRLDWSTDDRFRTMAGRLENRAALVEDIAAVLAAKPADYWVDECTRADVPCARFNTIPEALAEPQIEALELFGELEDGPGLTRRMLGLPFTIDGVRPLACKQAPTVGEHNDLYAPRIAEHAA